MKQTLEYAWDALSDKLRRFIRARVEDEGTADDILQDTFLRLHQRLADEVEPESISGWLHLVARRAIVDHYRARKPTSEIPETLAAEAATSADEDALCGAFRRMVDLLPEPYREAVV